MVAWYDENEDVPIEKLDEEDWLELIEDEKKHDPKKLQSFEEQERIMYEYIKEEEEKNEDTRCGMPVAKWMLECSKASKEKNWKRLSYLWDEDYNPRFIAKCKRLELMYENR